MDPVTTAILAALAAGANGAVGDVAKKAIVDGYDGLTALLKKKFGNNSPVAKAVEDLENEPESRGRELVVAEKMKAANVAADPEVLAAAQALLNEIKAGNSKEQHIQRIHGDLNATADHGSSASVNISGSVSKRE
jgi:hypothetical protein